MSEVTEVEDRGTKHSPSLAALAAALAKAQGQMRSAKKDSLNPHFKSSYADLASIMDACREALSANGLAYVQPVTTDAEGVHVTTMLLHSSGEWISCTCTMPLAQRTPQGVGSAITYGRRYSLSALVGIASEEDDDGNEASGRQPPSRPPPSSNSPPPQSRTEAAKEQVKARMRVVDVKPGESEAEATARVSEVSPWDRVQVGAKEYGIDGFTAADLIKRATGKAKREELVAADVPRVLAAFATWVVGDSPHSR